MQRLLQLPLMVILLGIGALSMAVPGIHATATGEFAVGRAFLYSGLLMLALAGVLAVVLWNFRPANVPRSHLMQLAMAYVVLPLALGWPMTVAMPGLGLFDAWFEMVSSFTTTGATVFDVPAAIAAPIHLWRALVGWMGGFLALLAAVAILAQMNLGGYEVISGQVAGRGASGAAQITRVADPSRRMQLFAGQMLPVYAGLTGLLFVALLMAGDAPLVAACHAFSTLSTSGISPVDGMAGSGHAAQALVLLFCVFALTRQAFPGVGKRFSAQQLWGDPELRLGLGLIGLTGLALVALAWARGAEGVPGLLWAWVFTAASFLTTTGFVAPGWPDIAAVPGFGGLGLCMVVLALIGGGVATAAGGTRLLRVVVLARLARRQLRQLSHPHAVGSFVGESRARSQQGAQAAWIFLALLLISLGLVMAALTLTGVDWQPALVLAVATLTGTGPLASVAGDGVSAFADLSVPAKAILAAAMIIGRLETLAVLALLVPFVVRS